MRLLLDTHVALWAIADSPRLSGRARELITDPSNEVHVSVASLWEIAVKHALNRKGKGAMPVSAKQALAFFEKAGFALLDVDASHVVALETLAPLHADPFDRMLIAQAVSEPLRLLTHDGRVAAYGDMCLAV